MNELHWPWLELAVLVPFVGALCVGQLRNAARARNWSLTFSGITLACAVGAWLDLYAIDSVEAHDAWDFVSSMLGRNLLVVDELSAPLLPLTALLYLLTAIATPRTKVRRFSFAWALFSEALALATLSCKEPRVIIVLLILSIVPPYLELRARGKPTRVFLSHMLLFAGLLIAGWIGVELEGEQRVHSLWAVLPLLGAVFIRSGMVPFHCWMTDLFEHATFGTALLYVTPMSGAYLAVRLVLPTAPDWVLHSIGVISLVTAVYSAGMALVQREARRFFCYLFLSHAALVLVGLETAGPIGMTGALCVWLSVGMALAGFGLTLRALESRRGRVTLTDFHGVYEHTPILAICFLLTGLASVGFPGTFGFIGMELLIDAAGQTYPYIGAAVVLAAALNGIAVVQAYFRLFTGTKYPSAVPLHIRLREQIAVLGLAFLILAGGLYPQPGVASRHHAAMEILRLRGGPDTVFPEHPVALEGEPVEHE
jgi:NADH-quinone oxidoreductase subunit M